MTILPWELPKLAQTKHLWRDSIVIPPGVYNIEEPITVDPGTAIIGGKEYHTRGKGPDIVANGVILKPTKDMSHVLSFVGIHPNVQGGHIDARGTHCDFGLIMQAKDVNGASEATGGRGVWTGLTVEGSFSRAAVAFDSAEELTFIGPNIYATGRGHALIFANGGLFVPAWSQTMVTFVGASLYSYGADVIKVIGDVQDISFRDCYAGSPKNLVDASEATGKRNVFDGRFECSSSSQIIVNSQAGWSRSRTVKSVSPQVSAMVPI